MPEEREIFSIQPVLEFLLSFANIGKIDCATDTELQTMEKRVKIWNNLSVLRNRQAYSKGGKDYAA